LRFGAYGDNDIDGYPDVCFWTQITVPSESKN
jgi:hypothetical protein